MTIHQNRVLKRFPPKRKHHVVSKTKKAALKKNSTHSCTLKTITNIGTSKVLTHRKTISLVFLLFFSFTGIFIAKFIHNLFSGLSFKETVFK